MVSFVMKNYALSGAIITVSIFMLKLLADLPTGIDKYQREGLGGSVSEVVGLFIVLVGGIALFGAVIGAIVGFFLLRENRRRQAQDAPRTETKRLE
jgi:NhaP-type Na+/H+ or K+/H+ antiporter